MSLQHFSKPQTNFMNKMKLKAILIGITLFFTVFALLYSPTLGKNRDIFGILYLDNHQKQNASDLVQTNSISSQANSANNQNQQNSNSISEDNADIIEEKNIENQETNQDLVLVTKVIDGDTIEIEGSQKVRYIGIDTPETVHPSKPVQCFGKEASNKNKELVQGKKVRLEKDVSETDKYGRLLRYVYLEDGTFINQVLVEEGYARISTYPPDVKYQEDFQNAEQQAREENLGLWAGCSSSDQTQQSQTGNCTIKGNISSSGGKIYHMSGQYYYNKTVIDESKGEKWFCTEAEAQAAGWRKSLK